MRCVVVATMRRGRLDPPELLDEANSWRVLFGVAEDEGECLRRARLNWQRERDPEVTSQEARRLRMPPESERELLQDAVRAQRVLRRAIGRT